MEGILEGFPNNQRLERRQKLAQHMYENIRNIIMYYISVSLCNGKTPGTIYSMIKTLTQK